MFNPYKYLTEMKTLILQRFPAVAAGTVAMMALMVACIKTPVTTSCETGKPVNIAVGTTMESPVSRTYHDPGEFYDGSPEDRVISSFRMLIYDAATGKVKWNILTTNPTAPPYKVNLLTGNYHFVFLANETSDATLAGLLAAIAPANNDDILYLDGLTIDGSAFASDRDIPMVTRINHVEVKGDNKVKTPAMSADNVGTWSVAMTRVGIRISVELTLTPNQYDNQWKKSTGGGVISLGNIPEACCLMSGNTHPANPTGDWEEFEATLSGTASPGYILAPNTPGNPTANYIVRYDRIILPELLFDPTGTAGNALQLSLFFDHELGAKRHTAILAIPNPIFSAAGYTLPRNTWLHTDAVIDDIAGLQIATRVVPWNHSNLNFIFDIENYLRVNKTSFLFPYTAGNDTLKIETTLAGGWTIVNNSASAWLTPSPGAADTSPGVTASTVTLTAAANNTSSPRSGTFTVKAGDMEKTITVTQQFDIATIPGAGTPLPNTYVGAFWRAGETGERIIRITNVSGANTGDWMTSVAWMDDRWATGDIVLSTAPSADLNLGWIGNESLVADMSNPANDALYSVAGSAQSVGGNVASGGEIFFRIGLKSKFSASTQYASNPAYPYTTEYPARYAIVLLSYNLNGTPRHQKIYLRQGEDPDYLMRPEDFHSDGVTGWGSPDPRPDAVRFSPYNLTDPLETFNRDIGYRGAGFTHFPTQAGAFFQWANNSGTYTRYAWDAFTPGAPGGTWNNSYPYGYWTDASNLHAIHETCPAGYSLSNGATVNFRRPNDGATNANNPMADGYVSGSEMRQSLSLEPLTGVGTINPKNIVWGYYADGFFDRRQIDNALGNYSAPASVVSVADHNIAYHGQLFYNPATGASLFFPAGGLRNFSNGTLTNAGEYGTYWSSSSTASFANWDLHVISGSVSHNGISRESGLAVRCVVDEP